MCMIIAAISMIRKKNQFCNFSNLILFSGFLSLVLEVAYYSLAWAPPSVPKLLTQIYHFMHIYFHLLVYCWNICIDFDLFKLNMES